MARQRILITIPLLLFLHVTLLPAPATCGHLEYPQLIQLKHAREQQQSPHQLQISSAQVQPRVLPTSQQLSIIQSQQQQVAQQSNVNYMNSLSTNMNPYTNATHMLLLDLRQQLITRALKFDEHFRSLLSKSKISLHNMFHETYGMIYLHNTDIFTSMYEGLEQYYATGKIKLSKTMENFFERLYQKIFQVYNSNRAFTPTYLECATSQLEQLKPFGDKPEKITIEILHAFVSARTFYQGLNSGIEVIRRIISVSFLKLAS